MNKKKIYFLASCITLILIIIGAAIIIKNNDKLAPFQSYLSSKYQLDRSSLVEYEVNSYHVSFITDNQYSAHVFYVNAEHSIVNYLYVPKMIPEKTRVYWHTISNNGNVLFTSILYDDAIDRITVKSMSGQEMQHELKYIDYNDTRFVIAIGNQIERSPVDIVGYSKQNEAIYKNINDQHNR
ncbi:hypothetical protein [Paenibacillus apiarius]|uniref:hypothetical protein n=1 Tax=Paenibacillus apiarius TaxID=46240 RepID=UPI003B3A27F7